MAGDIEVSAAAAEGWTSRVDKGWDEFLLRSILFKGEELNTHL
jgi:hypothetical protein